ncbi:restriction endonuclease subunit S [Leptolyngbya sp. AN03gr2]|uniref:restriction endonuclease subunit S n=1 Tax=unclassified Leptolyngbya TaxID=2650499 RepID=UPI003D315CD2
MSVVAFFESFRVLADASSGVQKLRELILQLAVQGKLVSQNPEDEPAKVLLENVQAEKQHLTKIGAITKSRPLLPLDFTEIPYEVPKNWLWVRFGEIVTSIEAGTSPLCEKRPKDNHEWGVLKISAVSWDRFDPHQNKALPSNIEPRLEYEVKLGDFLMSRANTSQLVGKSVVVESTSTRLLISDKTLRVNFSKLLNKRFFNLYNNSISAREYYAKQGTGTSDSMKNITRDQIRCLPTPLPPIEEQKRIVNKVDQLMKLCDELDQRQKQSRSHTVQLNDRALAHLLAAEDADEFAYYWGKILDRFDSLYSLLENVGALRRSILQLAVQGKLVSQDFDDEPASILVERVLLEKKRLSDEGKLKKLVPQPAIEPEEILFNSPTGWAWARFGEISELASGVTKGRKLIGRETAFYPYLRVANVQRGFLDLITIKEIEIPVEELEKYRLQKGDVLLTEGGDWDKLGRSAIWRDEISDCIHQNHVFRARFFNSGISPEWAVLFTNSPIGRQYFETAAKKTTNLASINMTQLRNCPFPVPPAKEQKRIIGRVHQLMMLCDELEEKLRTSSQAEDRLTSIAIHNILNAG